jgi:hypothetical protein
MARQYAAPDGFINEAATLQYAVPFGFINETQSSGADDSLITIVGAFEASAEDLFDEDVCDFESSTLLADAANDVIVAFVDVPGEAALDVDDDLGAIAGPLADAPASDDTLIELIDGNDDDRVEVTWGDDGAVTRAA